MDSNCGVVHVIDDDPEVGKSIAWVLNSVGYQVEIQGTADQFLAKEIDASGCCLIVDLLMPGTPGMNLCRTIVARNVPCCFLVITGNGDVKSAVDAMQLGASDFLEKPFGKQQLLDAVGRAVRTADARHQSHKLELELDSRLAKLSARERGVFDAVSAGLLTKEIAKRLGISTRTVDVHRSRIMQKLEISSPTQLAHLLAFAERRRARLTPLMAS